MSAPYILIVDDEPEIRGLVQEILEDEGYEITVAENGVEAREKRRERKPDLVLLDVWMPDVDGISLLKEWQEDQMQSPPVIIMSGHGTVETAVEATRLGAYDFLEKPLSMAKLLVTVERALEAARLQRENIDLKRSAGPVSDPIGKSPELTQLREQVKRIAQHDATVLITGEAGSGKEVVARYLHAHSNRRDGPFISVSITDGQDSNAAALALFGSEDNGKVHYGHLENASGGILFLNDIVDLDPTTQGRLFSALANQNFMRVGGAEPVHTNVRIVTATHHNPEQAVKEGRFREELYYQLNVLPIQVPALREHIDDVSDLLTFYVALLSEREHLPFRSFTVAAQNRLRNYSWPGNVRELKNLVQRLLILGSGSDIELDEVEQALGSAPIHTVSGTPQEMTHWLEMPLREAREQFEKTYLEHHLKQAGGSVGKMSKHTGMERTHLYRKLRALGVDSKKRG